MSSSANSAPSKSFNWIWKEEKEKVEGKKGTRNKGMEGTGEKKT